MRQHAARELDGDRRREALVDRQQPGLHALLVVPFVVDDVLEVRGHRPDEAVAQQDAEERADQRRADLVADLRRRAVDLAHRDDDAEHRGDDAEAGQRVADLGERLRRLQRLVVMDLEVLVHQRLEVVGRDAADDDHLHRVGEEVDRVMAGEEARVLREDRALVRILEVRLERHHARLLRQSNS